MTIEAPDDLSGCPYYQSGGICIYGCWSEPACITDRPQDGWPSERDDPDDLPGGEKEESDG